MGVYYFAYGANMSIEILEKRVGKVVTIGPAMIDNYKLIFPYYSINRKGLASSVTACDDSIVYGILYSLTEQQMNRLDKYEGVKIGNYERRTLSILKDNFDSIKAIVYVIDDKTIYAGYSEEYLDTIIENLPKITSTSYIESLRYRKKSIFVVDRADEASENRIEISANRMTDLGLTIGEEVIVAHKKESVKVRLSVNEFNHLDINCRLGADILDRLGIDLDPTKKFDKITIFKFDK